MQISFLKEAQERQPGELSDAELSSSECIKADLDAVDGKGQESSSDQEQADVNLLILVKRTKWTLLSPEQSKNVLQFTEEKRLLSLKRDSKHEGKGKY